MWCWPNGSTSRRPTIPPLTGYYGPRDPIVTPGGATGGFHTGVDTVGHTFSYNVGPGVVVYAARNADYGNEVRVRHVLPDGTVFTSRHCHLADGSVTVRVGQTLSGGEIVGRLGDTGKAKGVHLHLRFDKPGGVHFDPLPFLSNLITAGGGASGDGISNPEEDLVFNPVPYLLYNPSSQHPVRRAWWTPGFPLDVLTESQAVVGSALQKQMRRVSSTTTDAAVTMQVTDQMWDFIVWLESHGTLAAPEFDTDKLLADLEQMLAEQPPVPVDVDEGQIAQILAEKLGPSLDEATVDRLVSEAVEEILSNVRFTVSG